MAIQVNTNVSSLVAQNSLTKSTNSLNTTMQRLSTGYKINSAKDDAAGSYIATNMETQVRGSKVAQSNVATGANALQIAEGNLNVVKENLQRIRDLAVQAANGVYSAESMKAMEDEVTQRANEITRVTTSAEFNGLKLFDTAGQLGTSGMRLQVGANSDAATNAVTIDASVFKDMKADSTAIGLTAGAITTAFASAGGAAAFIQTMDNALKEVNTRKSTIGAYQNRLDSAANTLMTNIENTSAARSTIMDADVAEESANLAKYQILQQVGATILAQANSAPQIALSLLR